MQIRSCKIRVGSLERLIRFNDPKSARIAKYPWQELSYCKCKHCPLDSETEKCCPLAYDVADIVNLFSDIPSYAIALVTIQYDNFIIDYSADAQNICFNILLHTMASSDCPVFAKYSLFADESMVVHNIEDIFMRFMITFGGNKLITENKMPDDDEIRSELSVLAATIDCVKQRIKSIGVQDTNSNVFALFIQIDYIFKDHLDNFMEKLKQRLRQV